MPPFSRCHAVTCARSTSSFSSALIRSGVHCPALNISGKPSGKGPGSIFMALPEMSTRADTVLHQRSKFASPFVGRPKLACAYPAALAQNRVIAPDRMETRRQPHRKSKKRAQGVRQQRGESFRPNERRYQPLCCAQQPGVITRRADQLYAKRHVILAG
jgi:hypothetical protein